MIVCCMEWKLYWSRVSHQYIIFPNIYRGVLHSYLFAHILHHSGDAAPVQGSLHPQEHFPSSLHSAVTPHCTLLHSNLSLRPIFLSTVICITVFLGKNITFLPFSSLVLQSFTLFLSCFGFISVQNQSIQCKVIPPSMWFILFWKGAVKCWDFEILHLF